MRKAQAPNAIFGLVLIIGLFIVLFVLLLPPKDREELLNQTGSQDTGTDGVKVNGVETLVLESPGFVSDSEKGEIKHEINPITLFVKTSPEIIELADSAVVERSLFSEKEQNFAFGVEDLENLEDVKLD